MLVEDEGDSVEECAKREGPQLAHLRVQHPAFTPRSGPRVNVKGFRDELRESNEQERPRADQKDSRNLCRGEGFAQRQDEDDAGHCRQSREEVVDSRLHMCLMAEGGGGPGGRSLALGISGGVV